VRHGTAALVAIVMLGMLTTDSIACPDGCTEPGHAAVLGQGPDAQDADDDTRCALCAGTIPAPEPAQALLFDMVPAPDYPLPHDARAAVLTPRIDHPPRAR
jgi:hypothetical protein